MAVYGERTKRTFNKDIKGVTGRIVLVADWTDIEDDYDSSLPVLGSPWSAQYPYLRCVNIKADEIEAGMGEVIADFSTERQLAEAFVEISKSFESEIVDESKGYEWETAGTSVEISLPKAVPVTIWSVRVREVVVPDAAIRLAQNKVNLYPWNDVQPGYLRFDGANQDRNYDADGNIISIYTIYKFTEKSERSWYDFWRTPLAARRDGAKLYYQDNDSADTLTYTTDDTLVGTEIPVSGTAGTADWDRPKHSGSYFYESCDFESVLGIPG